MRDKKFFRLGTFIYHWRWYIITFWFILALACLPILPDLMTPFKTTGFVNKDAKSQLTQKFITQALGYHNYNKWIIIYHSDTLKATDPAFKKKIKQSLSDLKTLNVPYEVLYPEDNKAQISKDKHSAYAVVTFKIQERMNDALITRVFNSIKTPKDMSIIQGGEALFEEYVNQQTQQDLYDADFVATPLALITLIIVFGTLASACLPLLLGGVSAVIILTTLYIIGHYVTLSIFTLNIALLLGLCLSLDYALFIISRYRDELDKKQEAIDAIAYTQVTAGKAIFYSGLAVFTSVSALLFFPINILFSLAIGGLVAVFTAVLVAVILLPAILSVLQDKINRFPIKWITNRDKNRPSLWQRLAEKITKRPMVFFFPVLIILLLLGYPFQQVKLGISDFRILPEQSENRLFFDTFSKQFNERDLTPIELLVQSNTAILSEKNLAKLQTLSKQIAKNASVDHLNSIVSINPKLSTKQYYYLYKNKKNLPDNLKSLLDLTTGSKFTVMSIVSKYPSNNPKTKQLIQDLEHLKAPEGMNLSLTGQPIIHQDLLDAIYTTLPYALLWIILSSYIILLFLLRSLILPLKAIVMNILSLSACYGALVLVFQDGYLHEILNFQPQGMLDITLLVIIFCALFGFSMDYEVFLLTRIKECYDTYHDNKKSIIFGIDKSSRVITSAALIVICICLAFLVADVLMVKAFGLGIAVAIFVDAFLIRTLLVPSTMTLLGDWNWYLPAWLNRLLPHE